MKMRVALNLFILLTVVLLSACNFPSRQAVVDSNNQVGSIQIWIDAPLDGSTIPFVSYEIVLHAYDPAGVTQVELSANGNLLANLPNPDPGKPLVTLKYAWVPAAPGNYTLYARALGTGGASGSEATAVVTVSDFTVTPVNTSTVTVTLTPAGTSTPTSTATTTVTSTAATLSFTPRISTNAFYFGTCGSDQVTIQVLVPGDNVAGVALFVNLQDAVGGSTTGWDEGASMESSGDGWFSRTITARSLASTNRFNKAWLLYQFVAIDRANMVIGRSQVFSDITLASCSDVQPPSGIITVTPVPFIIFPPIRRIPSATPIPIPVIK